MIKKIALVFVAVLVLLLLGAFVFVQFTWDHTFEAPYPEITANTDSATIARGKYLAFGPAHCASCHVPIDQLHAVDEGLEIPLSGGWELAIPPGTFRAPNITPDQATGIGKLSDQEISRVLRYSVGHDGRAIFPFMPFQELSDADLTAIISFLRSQPAVKNEVKRSELTFLGKALKAFGLLDPEGPKNTPPKSVVIDSTVAYGSYIANQVANCRGCHTERDLKTGAFIGVDFAGGMIMAADDFSEGYSFITPNLTPDKETGIMANWSEAAFINRFKGGRVYHGSPMPWGAYSRMNDLELKALYRFLKSLEPVSNKIAKTAFPPGEKMPE